MKPNPFHSTSPKEDLDLDIYENIEPLGVPINMSYTQKHHEEESFVGI